MFPYADNTSFFVGLVTAPVPFQPGCGPRFSSRPRHGLATCVISIGCVAVCIYPPSSRYFVDLTAFHSIFVCCYLAASRASVRVLFQWISYSHSSLSIQVTRYALSCLAHNSSNIPKLPYLHRHAFASQSLAAPIAESTRSFLHRCNIYYCISSCFFSFWFLSTTL